MKRPWVKVRLSTRGIAQRATAAIARWTRASKCAPNLEKAIVLYDALSKGDLTLLHEYFPMTRHGVGAGQGMYVPPKRDYGDVGEVEYVEQTEDQKLDSFRNGFGGFGG